jgi:hypothetical protein
MKKKGEFYSEEHPKVALGQKKLKSFYIFF